MTWTNLCENFVANVDTHLPWLLASLESFENAIPATARILLCVPLVLWLVWSRQRRPAPVMVRLDRFYR